MKKTRRLKKSIRNIIRGIDEALIVLTSMVVFMPFRDMAVLERGNSAIGGELLVPFIVCAFCFTLKNLLYIKD